MYKALSPGAIGVQTPTIESSIAAAKLGGFAGVEISPSQIADRIDRDGAESVKRLFDEAGIKPAGFGLPTEFRSDDVCHGCQFPLAVDEPGIFCRWCLACG